jgi:hypothetical protein
LKLIIEPQDIRTESMLFLTLEAMLLSLAVAAGNDRLSWDYLTGQARSAHHMAEQYDREEARKPFASYLEQEK